MGTVIDRVYLGNVVNYLIEVNGLRLRAQAHRRTVYAVGAVVGVTIAGDHCVLFPEAEAASAAWDADNADGRSTGGD